MSKWPKEWVDAVFPPMAVFGEKATGHNCRSSASEILNNLHNIGALKDPPKPREWCFCTTCGDWSEWESWHEMPAMQCEICDKVTVIHVREVEDE